MTSTGADFPLHWVQLHTEKWLRDREQDGNGTGRSKGKGRRWTGTDLHAEKNEKLSPMSPGTGRHNAFATDIKR